MYFLLHSVIHQISAKKTTYSSAWQQSFSSIVMKTLNDVFCKTKNLRKFLAFSKKFHCQGDLVVSNACEVGAKLAMRQNITSRYPIRRSFPSINDLRGRAPSFKGPQHGANLDIMVQRGKRTYCSRLYIMYKAPKHSAIKIRIKDQTVKSAGFSLLFWPHFKCHKIFVKL